MAANRAFDSGGATLAQWGEGRLLRAIVAKAKPGADIEVGPGDDAAVISITPELRLVASQDALVEGKDFRRNWITPYQLGGRAFNVAASDMAGMGAKPRWCMVTVCAPATANVEDLLELQQGVLDEAGKVDCALIGGDLSDIDGPLVIDVAVIGTASRSVLRRDLAKPGMLIAVTGCLGGAGAGLRCLRQEGGGARAQRWITYQLQPRARIPEGLHLVGAGIRCGGDISDGLVVEAERIAGASGCGVELWLDHLPVDQDLQETFNDWVDLALGGGEDFELIFCAPKKEMDQILSQWPVQLAKATIVGCITDTQNTVLKSSPNGQLLPLPAVLSRHWQ